MIPCDGEARAFFPVACTLAKHHGGNCEFGRAVETEDALARLVTVQSQLNDALAKVRESTASVDLLVEANANLQHEVRLLALSRDDLLDRLGVGVVTFVDPKPVSD